MRRLHLRIVSVGIGVLALTLLAAAVGGQTPVAQQQPIVPAGGAAGVVAPLDQAIAWLNDAKRNHSAVKDYTCTLISRENIKGKLQKEDNIMQMKFRTAPFSVYMRWLAPNESKNQEVAFVAGKNNNQMRVHSTRLKGLVGFVSVELTDPRVAEHSRHKITDAGIGRLIDQTLVNLGVDKQLNRTETKIAEYEYDGRRCIRIENIRPDRNPAYYAHRSVLYLDKDSKLPIRNENYDWPRAGAPQGELLEVYSYVNLRFNVGLTNRDFDK